MRVSLKERERSRYVLNTFDDRRTDNEVKPAGRASERQKGNVIVLGAQRSMGGARARTSLVR